VGVLERRMCCSERSCDSEIEHGDLMAPRMV
jgi:hypothetical protein